MILRQYWMKKALKKWNISVTNKMISNVKQPPDIESEKYQQSMSDLTHIMAKGSKSN